MSEHAVSKVLDLKGLPCPMPVVKISQEIGSVAVGEVIEVHTTDPGSLSDFPAWAKTKVKNKKCGWERVIKFLTNLGIHY